MDPFLAGGAMFAVMFGFVALIILAGFVFVIVTIVRNARKVKQAGYDPLTLNADLATRALDSDILRPSQSIEQRLAELDELTARGVISAEERAAARADILRG